jgi:ribosomal protein S6--L-glutamate ligase
MVAVHIVVLGNPGSFYCRDLERAIGELGHRFSRADFQDFTAKVACTGPTLASGDHDLSKADVVIVRTMPPGSLEQVVFRMDALARIEASGVLVVNSPKAIECAVDKYLTTSRLEAAGLTVPPTIVCENAEDAMSAFDTLGGDVVVKPLFGSEGRGIVRVSDPEIALRTFRTLARIQTVLYLQQFVDNEGFDIRVLVLNGRIVGGMRRNCGDDFRANVTQQGRGEVHQLTDSESQLALRATEATGCRFAGVDLIYDRRGGLYVIEVNAVPGWRAFRRVTGCDVAQMLIQSVIQSP